MKLPSGTVDIFENVWIGIVDKELELGIGLNVWYLSLNRLKIYFIIYDNMSNREKTYW